MTLWNHWRAALEALEAGRGDAGKTRWNLHTWRLELEIEARRTNKGMHSERDSIRGVPHCNPSSNVRLTTSLIPNVQHPCASVWFKCVLKLRSGPPTAHLLRNTHFLEVWREKAGKLGSLSLSHPGPCSECSPRYEPRRLARSQASRNTSP